MADASLLIEINAKTGEASVAVKTLEAMARASDGSIKSLERLSAAMAKAEGYAAGFNQNLFRNQLALEKVALATARRTEAEARGVIATEKAKNAAAWAAAELANLIAKTDRLVLGNNKLSDSHEKVAQTTKNSKKDWTDLFSSLLNARTGMDGLLGGMLRLGTGAYLMVRGMQTLLNLVKAVPEALLTAAGSAEKTQIALVALTGSVESGTLAYSQLLKLSRESGISGDAAKDTIVRMRGFGVATNELIPLMQKMTIATRGDSDAMQRLGLVYGQVTQQGRTFGDDLRQIYNTGVPLAGAIAKVLDIPVSRLREAGKEGKITAAVLDEALTKLTEQGSLLGNAWEEGMNSAISKTNQLKESWSQLLATTGSGVLEFYKPAIEFTKKALNDLNDAMQFEKFRTNLREGLGLKGIDIDSALRGGAAAQSTAILNSQAATGSSQIYASRMASDTINANQQLLEAVQQNQKTADSLAAIAERQRLLGLGAATPALMADEAMAAIRAREKELKDPKQRLLEGLRDDKEVAKAMVEAITKLIDEETARAAASFAGAIVPKKGIVGKGEGFTGVQDPRLKPQFDLLNYYTDIADATKGTKPPKTPGELFNELLLKYQQAIAGEFANLELDSAYDDKMFEMYRTFIDSIEDLILSSGADDSVRSWWEKAAVAAAENLNAPMLGIPKAVNPNPNIVPPGRNPWELIPALPEGESWWAEEEAQRLAEMYQAVENLKGALGDLTANAGLDALFAMGELFVNGAAGADDFAAAIGNIGLSLLKQLPQMFLAAGLNILINDSKDARGWGLIAMAAGTSVVSGIASANADRGEKAATSGSGVIANSLGNIYGSSGLISAFASGGIVSSPTLFNHAGGFGVMGEKGPEAIMPVTRTASGKLGVSAVGGSTSIVVIDQSTRVNGVSATTEETTNSSGGKQIRVVLRDTVRSMIANGELDTQLKTRGVPGFGGVRRS